MTIVSEKYPKLNMTEHILRVHVKAMYDGTQDTAVLRKGADRPESDHFSNVCFGIVQIDIEFQNGERAVLWREEHPNSITTNPPHILFKAEEDNRPSNAVIMHLTDKDIKLLTDNFLDLKVDVVCM